MKNTIKSQIAVRFGAYERRNSLNPLITVKAIRKCVYQSKEIGSSFIFID